VSSPQAHTHVCSTQRCTRSSTSATRGLFRDCFLYISLCCCFKQNGVFDSCGSVARNRRVLVVKLCTDFASSVCIRITLVAVGIAPNLSLYARGNVDLFRTKPLWVHRGGCCRPSWQAPPVRGLRTPLMRASAMDGRLAPVAECTFAPHP
jgi:hypothetical protein